MEHLIEARGRGAAFRVILPEQAGSRRYPMILCLEGRLRPEAWTDLLTREGVLPPVITACITEDEGALDPAELATGLFPQLPVLENPAARWLVGTGRTGVLALEALLDHPELFGAAACLSASFEGAEGAPPAHSRALRRLEERPALPRGVKLYADHGTLGLDECYEPYHRDLGSILRSRGWRDRREFVIRRIPGGAHDHASWQERLGPALSWLSGR